MTTGERSDPYLGFRFYVELDGLIVGGFSEIGGLEVSLETESYEEGGELGYTYILPTRMSYPHLTLQRGITDSTELWEWMNAARFGPPERKSGQIIVMDSTGEAVRGWAFRDGYPVKWDGPELRAEGGIVAVEALEIAHHGLDQFTI